MSNESTDDRGWPTMKVVDYPAEADAQREPELSNAEIAENAIKASEANGFYFGKRQRAEMVALFKAALDAKDTRPTVAERRFANPCPYCNHDQGVNNASHCLRCGKSLPSKPSVEATEIRRQAFELLGEATAEGKPILRRLTTYHRNVENGDYVECSLCGAEVKIARDAAPTPTKDSGDEAKG